MRKQKHETSDKALRRHFKKLRAVWLATNTYSSYTADDIQLQVSTDWKYADPRKAKAYEV